ncbi:MAG: TonB-dependent receptor [Proteobacteria bacterium]|nr:TonB-dependent receptor [Pseudomonadota bacterium]
MTAQRLIERRRVFPPFTVKAAIVAAMIAWHATCGAAAVQIDLPSQPLPSSLAMLAAQTGIEVDVDDALVQGRSSPAVSGMLEPAAALQALLTGADLVAVRGEGGTYAVVAASGAATVERIEVRGRHEREAPASALRMNVPLLDAPLSVQVIDKDTLDLQGVFDPQDALVNVPGAVRASSFTGLGETFLLRGFVQPDLVKDGFRAGEVGIGSINATGPTDMVNIDSIEVVKGPTAVLFGRGEPGGTVNYVTRKPTFENTLDIAQRFGSEDFYRSELHGNWTAMPERVALRLDAAYDTAGSFVDIADGERFVLAPSALIRLAPSTTLLARGEFVDDEHASNPGVPVVNGRTLDDIPYGRYFGESDLTRFEHETWRGVVELEHRWNDAQVSRITAHGRKAMTDGAYFILFNFAGAAYNPLTHEVSRSLAVVGYDDQNSALRAEHSIDASLFTGQPFAFHNQLLIAFEHENLSAQRLRNLGGHAPLNALEPVYGGYQPRPLVPFPGFPLNFNEQTAVDADEESLLILNRVNWRELVYLTVGARFEWFDASQSSTYPPGLPFTNSAIEQAPYRANPTVGVVVKPRPFLSLYANYAESTNAFRAFQSATASGDPLEPEQARQWELGVKSELLDKRVVTTLSAFHIRKSNVVGADPANPLFSINAGAERSRGLEFDTALNLYAGWRVNANYAFTDARITDDPGGANSGHRRFGVPEHAAALFSVYELQQGPLRGLGIGGGLRMASQVEIDNGNVGELPGYVQADALVYYKFKHWQAQLNARNLLDKEYYFTSGDGISVWPAASRSIIATLRTSF